MMGNITATTDINASPWTSVLNTIGQAGTAYLSFEQQRELLKTQAERARLGLPPLNASEFGLGVNVGVDSSTQNTLLLVGGGVALALLVSSFIGRSRR